MIHLLPPELANKIAAGEVVERPASIVKELVENAVDAKATRIEVGIRSGGIHLIQVVDNGVGMDSEDAKRCLLRHATSKISSADDLFAIQTMGFRGEALASIASVSQFHLVTTQEGTSEGTRVWLDLGHQVQSAPQAANPGTVVTVENLFYNVPARQKFLKTPATEYGHILRYLQQFALVSPELEIILSHNDKEVFHYLAGDWGKRVEEVLGKDFFSKMIPVKQERNGLGVEGWVAKPELVHASHKNQYLFVNHRPVYDHLVNRWVLEAYETLVPRGYFPAFVLRLNLDPSQVDVNVHPRKSEVKFLKPQQIKLTLDQAIKPALDEADLAIEHQMKAPQIFSVPSSSPASFSKSSWGGATSSEPSTASPSGYAARQQAPFRQTIVAQDFSGGVSTYQQSALQERGWKVLGQIHLSFLCVETPDGLRLLDQHAVSEITNYHRLIQERERGEICSQQMLIPVELDIGLQEKEVVLENKGLLERIGWEISELGKKSLQISALPEILKIENIQENFLDMVDCLKDEKNVDSSKRELEILKYEACRGAVMFGDPLSLPEAEALLNEWIDVPNNAACEHGRPAMAKITVQEMKKYFKR